MTFVWLAVALAFAVAEMLTLAFYAIFFVVAGVVTAVAAALGLPPVGQVIVFCLVSVLGVVLGRPPIMTYLRRRRGPESMSGAQSMIGKEAPVVEAIADDHRPGHVQIAGERWPATSADGSPIADGSIVRVDRLHQATLVVSLVRGPGPRAPEPLPEPDNPPVAPAEPSPTAEK